jgi:hypothetical protein
VSRAYITPPTSKAIGYIHLTSIHPPHVHPTPHRSTSLDAQLDEDAREQREMELKRKRMLRRRTEGQGDDDGQGEEEEAAAVAAAMGEGGERAGAKVSRLVQSTGMGRKKGRRVSVHACM